MAKIVNPTKSNSKFDFVYRYMISLAIIIALSTLSYQNFSINNFPKSLNSEQASINKIHQKIQILNAKNQHLKTELTAHLDKNLEIIESSARQRFGLIKKNEVYYQFVYE
jgi:cell division protein FtsB